MVVHIKNIIYWLDSSAQQLEWIRMEKEDCAPYDLGAIIFSPIKLNNMLYKKNPIIQNTIRIWKQIKLTLKLRNLSVLTPIVNNPVFKPSGMDKTYKQWEKVGIKKVGDLYELGNLLSFQQLKSKFKLNNNQYFKYLQVCDFMNKYIPRFQSTILDPLEEVMNINAESTKLISYLYNSILNIELPSTEAIREDWEKELMIKISKETWEKYLIHIHKCSINARHNLIQFKILHRLYSKTRLNKFYPNISRTCDKCLSQNANITHSFVSCSKLYKFWCDIFDIFSKIFKTKMEPNTEMIIFGVSGDGNKLNTHQN
ncbi:palmitoyltransferase ZDHHC21 isoform X1 [Leucoraja erinacea]|uniref:palmitoyltransferase ZDHHC21 isoform X1 n=1 Tax=Leucoraja erinaceus TaxID=7782 RepID=UPI002458AB06|nr:palmitoyltransferase ZDHHC21 isoform X1 [Leucoraja erinacea]